MSKNIGRDGGNAVMNSLINEGPQAKEELPGEPSSYLKQDGMARFDLPPAKGSTAKTGITTSVYYVEWKHSELQVLEKFFDLNPHTREKASDWSLHIKLCEKGDGWKEASRDFLDNPNRPGSENGPWNENEPQEQFCPFCGESCQNIPRHLPCEESP